MTYFVRRSYDPPQHQRGALVDWESIVPDLQRRADISGIWSHGRGTLDPKEMPKAVSLKWYRSLAPVFSSDGGIIICSAQLKGVLGEFDPGLHQFIPIKITFQSGEVPEGSFFILNVHHMLDTIIDEKTKADSGPQMPGESNRHYKYLHIGADKDGDVTVDKLKLTSTNLWREKAYTGLYMMSDRLQQRLEQEKLAFFEPYKATEF